MNAVAAGINLWFLFKIRGKLSVIRCFTLFFSMVLIQRDYSVLSHTENSISSKIYKLQFTIGGLKLMAYYPIPKFQKDSLLTSWKNNETKQNFLHKMCNSKRFLSLTYWEKICKRKAIFAFVKMNSLDLIIVECKLNFLITLRLYNSIVVQLY